MITNDSVHIINTMLTEIMAGASDGGSTKLGLTPAGGFPMGISDKGTWPRFNIVIARNDNKI